MSKVQGAVHALVAAVGIVYIALFTPVVFAAVFALLAVAVAWRLSTPFLTPAHVGGRVVALTRFGRRVSVTPEQVHVRGTYGIVYGLFVPRAVGPNGEKVTVWSMATSTEDEAFQLLDRHFSSRGYATVKDVL
ncbi:MAG: hypothetical protein M3445_01975 [Actinomycetota bacterium]|nr:hypothetical protein [Actinomycetota bacterium]